MGVAAKNKNFVNKGELDFYQGGGVGWHPDYVKTFEGQEHRDNERYGKNFSRMKGVCKKCDHFDKTVDKADGSRCKLGKGVACTK
jgi:hypothetical protein